LAVADHEQDVPAGVQALLQEGATAGKISVDVTGQGVPGQKSGFIWIPNFVMNHMAQELNMRNRMKCEALCLKNKECRSYSWRQKDKLCVWSVEALHYHYNWDFYTKVHEMNALGEMKHHGKYRKFTGIMYQEPGYHKYKKKTVKQCKELCTKAPKCKAFSYHDAGERCYLTDAGIHYDVNFQYYERRNMAPRKSPTQVEDEQEALQHQEVAAKKAKANRILESIRKRKAASARAAREMRAKKVSRETFFKKKMKRHAEKTLQKEKAVEKHDKRMARMKAAYNEGYFKAKGIVAEKKVKEKSIKALRNAEKHDKNQRIIAVERKKKRKIAKEKAKKKHERDTKQDLLVTKEKLVKLKNKEIKTEIAKEEKVLDVAKDLAVSKVEIHDQVVHRDIVKKRAAAEKDRKKTQEMRVKGAKARKFKKKEAKKLDKLKHKPVKVPAPPQGKRKGKATGAKGKRKGKAKGKLEL